MINASGRPPSRPEAGGCLIFQIASNCLQMSQKRDETAQSGIHLPSLQEQVHLPECRPKVLGGVRLKCYGSIRSFPPSLPGLHTFHFNFSFLRTKPTLAALNTVKRAQRKLPRIIWQMCQMFCGCCGFTRRRPEALRCCARRFPRNGRKCASKRPVPAWSRRRGRWPCSSYAWRAI